MALLLACAALLAPAIASASAASTAYAWRNVAVGAGGFVSGVLFHPRERGLAYARTDIGGAYRWDAAAKRWVPLLDWLPHDDANLMGVESLAVDPSDPERLYLAVGTYLKRGNGAILRSSDRGRTFRRADLPFPLGGNEMGRGNGERLAVDPNDGRVLFFGSRGAGLWRSGDGGASWKKVEAFPAVATAPESGTQTRWAGLQPVGIVSVLFDPASGRPGKATPTLYAAVSTRGTSLYVSHDGGARWAPVKGQPSGLRPTRMALASDGELYIAYGDEPGPNVMNDGALWRYSPAGGAWRDISPVPQSSDLQHDGFGWGAVAVDPANPKVLIASTFCRYQPHEEIFRSVDGGEHWTPILGDSQFDHSVVPWTEQAFPHWIASLAIDPFDPDRALFVTGYGLWASRNLTEAGRAPVRWGFDDDGLEETAALALASPSEGAHLISGVGDIDGFRHDDLDKYTLQFGGPRLTNTEAMAWAGQAPQVLVRAGRIRHHEGEVRALYSQDGGRSWKAFASEPPQGEGAGRITVGADGKRVIWTPSKSDTAWVTADFGQRWQAAKGLPNNAVVEADRFDAGTYYGFDPASGKLYRSGNGGVEFKEVAAGLGEPGPWYRAELRPSLTDPATVYIAAGQHGLRRWSAGGPERLPGVENAMSLGLGAPRPGSKAPTLFLYGQVGGVTGLFRSDDDGKRWTRIDDDAHRYGGMRLVTGDPRLYGRVYFAAEGRGVIYGDPH
ncbi:cellulase [[Pseudomonas] boreopolis]|uniref:Cellulase n=1 Tax=Xanthomonas boreopolis TaxID=86183 RepID=A0A919F8Z3_9XANT|nr:cellulase [[Pseudomonas] boreopolis]